MSMTVSNKRNTIDSYFKTTGKKRKANDAVTVTSSGDIDGLGLKEETTDGISPELKDKTTEVNSETADVTKEPKGKETDVNSETADVTKKSGVTETTLYNLDPIEYRLELSTIDPSWLCHLAPELAKPYFKKLKQFLAQQHALKKTVYPLAKEVYSWTRFAQFDSVRVVVLGQDPYHGAGQAHGLAFSVHRNVRTPPSLLNMYKALDGYMGFERPPHGFLGGWASQGVLLLNSALTVEAHKPNSHANKGWEQFTDRVIQLINEKQTNVVFMLWGAYAQKKGQVVDTKKHLVLKSVHPSPLSARRGFFECRHFEKANEYLEAHNVQPIDWTRLPPKQDE
ncbi:uracil DNA glycosylase [Coemansia sp. RSA 1935]|nr:uracil DNA glycosylase [Coemansia sp. RSA 1935]